MISPGLPLWNSTSRQSVFSYTLKGFFCVCNNGMCISIVFYAERTLCGISDAPCARNFVLVVNVGFIALVQNDCNMKNTCDFSWRTWGSGPEGLYRIPSCTEDGLTPQFPKISLDNSADKRREEWENLTLHHSSEGYWELINKPQGWPKVFGGCWSRSAEVFRVLWCVCVLGVLLILSQGGKRKHTWDQEASSSMYKSLL